MDDKEQNYNIDRDNTISLNEDLDKTSNESDNNLDTDFDSNDEKPIPPLNDSIPSFGNTGLSLPEENFITKVELGDTEGFEVDDMPE